MKTYKHIVDKKRQHWLTDDKGHYFNGATWVSALNGPTSQDFEVIGESTIEDFLLALSNILNQEAL